MWLAGGAQSAKRDIELAWSFGQVHVLEQNIITSL
jgi:hypothetical protein